MANYSTYTPSFVRNTSYSTPNYSTYTFPWQKASTPKQNYSTYNWAQNNVTPTRTTTTQAPTQTAASSASSTPVQQVAPNPFEDWQNYTNDQIASKLGFKNYSYQDILGMLNNASAAKFDEYDAQTQRTRDNNLRALEDTYSTYLQNMRTDRANAVSNGITKGTAAANQLTTMLANNANIAQSEQTMNDLLNDLALQRSTALAENANTARTEASAWDQYLGTLRSNYTANNVNRYAADITAAAQTKAAQIAANATTNAAGISANAQSNAANASYQWLLDKFVDDAGGNYNNGLKNYLNYFYANNANTAANTAYTQAQAKATSK